jgi:hypothetical protein
MHPIFVQFYTQFQEAKNDWRYLPWSRNLADLDTILTENKACFENPIALANQVNKHRRVEQQLLNYFNSTAFKTFYTTYNLSVRSENRFVCLDSAYIKALFMLLQINDHLLSTHYDFIMHVKPDHIEDLYAAMALINTHTPLTNELCNLLFSDTQEKTLLWNYRANAIIELHKNEYLCPSDPDLLKRLDFIQKYITLDRPWNVVVETILKLKPAHHGADYIDNEMKIIPKIQGDWSEFTTAWCYLHQNSPVQVSGALRNKTMGFLQQKINNQFDYVNIAIFLHTMREHLTDDNLIKLIAQPQRQVLAVELLKIKSQNTIKQKNMDINLLVDAIITNAGDAQYFVDTLEMILLLFKTIRNPDLLMALSQPGLPILQQGLTWLNTYISESKQQQMLGAWLSFTYAEREALFTYIQRFEKHQLLDEKLLCKLFKHRNVIKLPENPTEFVVFSDVFDAIIPEKFYPMLKQWFLTIKSENLVADRKCLNQWLSNIAIPEPSKKSSSNLGLFAQPTRPVMETIIEPIIEQDNNDVLKHPLMF